jgi:Uma2 family endonuclease
MPSMSTIETRPLITPDELLEMPDGDLYELVDGHLVERDMGFESSYIGARLARLIGNFCEDHPLGWVLGADCSYQCYPDRPKLVRKPDVSFIRLGRLPGEKPYEGHCLIPPDLAVEVVSPRDLFYEVSQKVEEYLGAGVRLVWVVDPEVQTVLIYRADGSIAGLRADGELDGEDVIPGFRCRVGSLFVMPGGA